MPVSLAGRCKSNSVKPREKEESQER